MQKINDSPLKKCPHCGKSQLQRLDVGAGVSPEGRRLVRDRFQGRQGQQANLADRPEADAPKEDKKETTETACQGRAGAKDAPGGAEKRPIRRTSRPRRPRRRSRPRSRPVAGFPKRGGHRRRPKKDYPPRSRQGGVFTLAPRSAKRELSARR
jgi:hypothetical protein